MNTAQTWFLLLLRLGIVTPIWLYLCFKVLQAVQATELMWFLFWVYVPVGILASSLATAWGKVKS